jgi:hypothetical protein
VLSSDLDDLPGADLVGRGLEDLARGAHSREALLVAAAATRLREAGLPVPPPDHLPPEPELLLYRRLRQERPADAYAFYNALLEQLISFASALERRLSGRPPSSGRSPPPP